MSTFSKLRVGKKGYLAGSPRLTIAVDSSATGVVGMLPPNAIVLSAIGSDALIEATIGDGTTVNTVAPTAVGTVQDFDPQLIAGPAAINIVTSVAASKLYIDYVLNDSLNGVNQ